MSIKIYAFADEAGANLKEQIEAMKANELSGLEIRDVNGLNVSKLSLSQAKEIKKQLDDAELEVWSIGSPIGKINLENDDFEEYLDVFRNTLEVSKILDAKCFRLFSFYISEGRDYGDFKNEVIDRIGRFVEIAKPYDVKLCHENEKGIYGDIADRCLDIFKAHPSIGGVFDPANFVQCGENTLKAWDMLGEYITYMHIKDAVSDGTVVPPGEGEGNLREITAKYIKSGGRVFTMEPHLTAFGGLEALEKDGSRSGLGRYCFKNNRESFDFACETFKKLII